jgi:hypothetical protein
MERQAGRQSTAREAAIIETGSRQGGRQLRARRQALFTGKQARWRGR